MQLFYAHIREDGAAQTVAEHLTGTAALCSAFAAAFQAEKHGELIGMAHDIGKYSTAFQRRLLEQGPKADHSTAGAFECVRRRQPIAALCVAGHHSGLPDWGSRTDNVDQPTLCGRVNRAVEKKIPDYSRWEEELTLPDVPQSKMLIGGRLGVDFYIRMLFSCLTDADFLDTERFMRCGETERDGGESLRYLAEKLDTYTQGWFPPRGELNQRRCAILAECIRKGDDQTLQPGFFTLTVPTGGGKTVASLAFALHHARIHGKQRIIYVIPYTSIIDQTADTFRAILGSENVLEHHSGVRFDAEEQAMPTNVSMMLATENWDKPVVVTTAVQFFESIYANRSSQCRKLHNIANSVIVFDEAQMLPLKHLRPCVSAIAQLVGNFGASAVLCTATQPALDDLIREFLPGQSITELCPASLCGDAVFRRVTFSVQGIIPWEELADRMREASQALCIVNTRKNAKTLYGLLADEEGSYHLSTLMVPAHRRACLDEIRERLKNGLPCRVVSTSLIEAGVDVDFPLVFRELAGLDSILQAAGRCNREGKHPADKSVVTVFRSETAIPPLFEKNADIASAVIGRYADISSDAAVSEYFRTLLHLTGKEAQDQKQVLPQIQSGSFPFAAIAKEFCLIDDDTETVYVPWGKGAALIECMRCGEISRALFREAAQYSVALYHSHFRSLVDSGDVRPIEGQNELWYLANPTVYSEKDGLPLKADSGQALII